MTTARYYPLPPTLVAAMRTADLFTGEFTRRRPQPEVALRLLEMGLVTHDFSQLTELGMDIRCWLMRGVAEAPAMVAKLLQQTNYRMAA